MEPVMVTSDLEKFPMNGREPGRLRMIVKGSLHSLPTTVFSDVTFGVVTRGKQELRGFVKRAFAAVPDFKYELRSWFARGSHRVGYVGHTQRRLPSCSSR